MKFTMFLKDLLSASKTKSCLTTMLVEGFLEYFSNVQSFKLVVVYENNNICLDFEEDHTHEEADTLIPNQVLASIYVRAPGENYVSGLLKQMFSSFSLI